MNKVIIGVSSKGLRTAVIVPTFVANKATTNPSFIGLAKINAVMTETSYNSIKEMK